MFQHMNDLGLIMIVGLGCEIVGASLIAMPILRKSKWNLKYLQELKKINQGSLSSLQNTSAISSSALARKIIEDEIKFIQRIENDEKGKGNDKVQTFIGLGLLITGFVLQAYVVISTLN